MGGEAEAGRQWAGEVYDLPDAPQGPEGAYAVFSHPTGDRAWLSRSDAGVLTGWVMAADDTLYQYVDPNAWALDVHGAEMAEVVARNPFTDDKPSQVMAHFIAEPPSDAMLAQARDVAGERMAVGPRMIYVSYGEGIGKSRLKLPAVAKGTARNMNSVARIADLLA